MLRIALLLSVATCLSGCGLVETTATTAAGASAEVEQAKQAKKIEDQVREQVQQDVKQNSARMQQAEKDAQ
jgi:uncharacterized protein YceK